MYVEKKINKQVRKIAMPPLKYTFIRREEQKWRPFRIRSLWLISVVEYE